MSESEVDSDLDVLLRHDSIDVRGARVHTASAKLNRIMAQKNIKITVDLGLGHFSATYYTCDLSIGYVRINSAYRT